MRSMVHLDSASAGVKRLLLCCILLAFKVRVGVGKKVRMGYYLDLGMLHMSASSTFGNGA